jgi:hypothetical protein
MSKVTKAANTQSTYVYASTYAIETTPKNHAEDGRMFVAADSEEPTQWPCYAKFFDSPERAEAEIFSRRLLNARVVRLRLQCKITLAANKSSAPRRQVSARRVQVA